MDAFLLFFFIFGIAGFCIWRLLIFSKERYGTNAPLKMARTYKITGWEYFTRIDNLVMLPFPIMAILFLRLIFTMEVKVEAGQVWLVYLVMASVLLMLFYISAYHIILNLNYWQFTKDASITTSPDDHTLFIDIQGKEFVIREGDIEKVLMVANSSKLYFSYFKYYLTNGDTFTLTDRTPGIWAIGDYFKRIPVEYEYKLFPFIK
jgi:hypothetical protein